jgi:predicted Zn-dependent protease
MRKLNEVQKLLYGVLSIVRAQHATVTYSYQNSLVTRFGHNIITQNMGGDEEWVEVEVAFGQKHGSSGTNRLDLDSIRETVRRAQTIAEDSPEDPEYIPPPGPQNYPEVPARYFEDVEEAGAEVIASKIGEVVDMARGCDCIAGGIFATGSGLTAVANTMGLYGHDKYSNVDFSVTIHGPDGSGFYSGNSESFGSVDPLKIAREAIETARAAQNPRDIEPGEYTVVFEPQAVFDFLTFLFMDLEARTADEGATVFSGQTGKQLFKKCMNISTRIDDPELPAPPLGLHGLASRNTVWIRDGIVERLRHDRYWASLKGTEPDPLLFPIFMDGEQRDLSELVSMCKKGLLVKRLWYIRHVDRKRLLLTGITRDGLFLIEDGKITTPVKNLRFNESPIVFLQNIIGMSRPCRIGNMAKVPGVMSEGFTFSSKTESI